MSNAEQLANTLNACEKSGIWYQSSAAANELRRLAAEVETLRAAIAQAQSLPDGPLSFNCTNGCGACGIKLVDFVTHAAQKQECDDWVVVASEPQIVSACCGSAVEVWDSRKEAAVGNVLAASPAQPVQPTRNLTIRELADVTCPWADVWTDKSFGIANAAIAKFCEVNGIAAPAQPKD